MELGAPRSRHANILVTGGEELERVGLVERLERSAIESRPFCAVFMPRDEDVLRKSLRHWLRLEAGPAPLACQQGTLYVDGVEHAGGDVQRLLLQLADRIAIMTLGRDALSSGPVRLAAGTAHEPEAHVVKGRLLAPLLDRIDKLRVDLGTALYRSG